MSHAPTPTLATAPVVALYLDNKLFKHFMKAYLKTQVLAQTALEINPKPGKQIFKARFPDLYYRNLYIDYYQFC